MKYLLKLFQQTTTIFDFKAIKAWFIICYTIDDSKEIGRSRGRISIRPLYLQSERHYVRNIKLNIENCALNIEHSLFLFLVQFRSIGIKVLRKIEKACNASLNYY